MTATSHIAEEILARAHPPEIASAIFRDKVIHKPLHLRPTSQDTNSPDARAKRRLVRIRKEQRTKSRQKIKPFSAKEKRVQGIYDVSKDQRRYDIYEPMHQMWLIYMREILGIEETKAPYITAQSKGSILASADYHGSELFVVRARCLSLVGLAGIVVKDTKFTFQIVTKGNEMKTIPKKHTIFRFEIPQAVAPADKSESTERTLIGNSGDSTAPLVFEIHGSQFESRPTDRSTKKFKQRFLKDL